MSTGVNHRENKNLTDQYFVVQTNDDGDVSLSVHTKTDLLGRLAEGYWSHIKSQIRDQSDLSAEVGTFIIKGKLVSPQPKQVVQMWEID